MTAIIPILLGIIPVMLKMRTNSQLRTLNIISEEIVKINDYSIELLELHANLKSKDSTVDDHNQLVLLTLKRKIDYHLEYLENKIKYFPYGLYNKLDFFFSKTYFFNKADDLFMKYQDCLRADTILSREIQYFDTNTGLLLKKEHLREVNYDDMVTHSNYLIEYLEEHILDKVSITFQLFMKKSKLTLLLLSITITFLSTLIILYIIVFILIFFDYLFSILITQ